MSHVYVTTSSYTYESRPLGGVRGANVEVATSGGGGHSTGVHVGKAEKLRSAWQRTVAVGGRGEMVNFKEI